MSVNKLPPMEPTPATAMQDACREQLLSCKNNEFALIILIPLIWHRSCLVT